MTTLSRLNLAYRAGEISDQEYIDRVSDLADHQYDLWKDDQVSSPKSKFDPPDPSNSFDRP